MKFSGKNLKKIRKSSFNRTLRRIRGSSTFLKKGEVRMSKANSSQNSKTLPSSKMTTKVSNLRSKKFLLKKRILSRTNRSLKLSYRASKKVTRLDSLKKVSKRSRPTSNLSKRKFLPMLIQLAKMRFRLSRMKLKSVKSSKSSILNLKKWRISQK